MNLLESAMAELRRRSGILPEEVGRWEQAIDANAKDLGIHRSQFDALKLMMEGLLEQQAGLITNLSSALPPAEFGDAYFKTVNQLVGSYELWRIFKYILAQREDAWLRPLLDAADLIASDCYRTPLKRAAEWGVITADKFREPPLIYLEAEISPSTASRGYSVTALSFPLRYYRNLRLPIPVVLLPFDHASSIWMYCSLHHEIGHNIDQDLKLSNELSQKLMLRLGEAGVPDERRRMWVKWTGEVLADTFGVLLGGAGFAHSLNSFLMVLAPSPQFQALNTNDPHPPFFVRLRLLAELLLRCGAPALTDAAAAIMAVWDARDKPAWVADYVDDSKAVAEVFLSRPLEALGNHAVAELVPNLAADAELAEKLVTPMLTGFKPPNSLLPTYPYRLIPVAAQLAYTRSDFAPETLKSIQERALEYLSRITRPLYLDGSTPVAGASRDQFILGLTRDIEFNQ